MVTRTFGDLVRDLRLRRTVGDRPPVLLLGAGASVDAGIGAMNDLFAFFRLPDFAAFSKYIAPTTAAERYRYLADFLQTRKPAEVTPGYRALATLCAQNYFDLVLTTNMDPLLDDALAAAQLWRRDYLLIVNGVIRPDRLELLLGGQSPRVKIVKLHGDLFQRFMAWTVKEMDQFLVDVMPQLKPAIAGRDVLVVGHSLRDERIRELAESTGGAVWFTHPQRLPEHLTQNANETMRTVIAPEAAFEKIFPALAAALQLTAAPAPVPAARTTRAAPAAKRGSGQTLDDVLAAVLTVLGPTDEPSSTAFLLDDPRVIVCDAYAVAFMLEKSKTLKLIASDHRTLQARVLRTDRTHPFGPTLLDAPASLKIPGLRVDASRLQKNDPVQIAVAAGEKTGLSSGTVTRSEVTDEIQPVGRVGKLTAIEAFVRGGASGAPVVDATMAVRGFIVAGSSKETEPKSFIYPSRHWATFLTRGRTGRRRAQTR